MRRRGAPVLCGWHRRAERPELQRTLGQERADEPVPLGHGVEAVFYTHAHPEQLVLRKPVPCPVHTRGPRQHRRIVDERQHVHAHLGRQRTEEVDLQPRSDAGLEMRQLTHRTLARKRIEERTALLGLRTRKRREGVLERRALGAWASTHVHRAAEPWWRLQLDERARRAARLLTKHRSLSLVPN